MRTFVTCAAILACAACTQQATAPTAKPDTAAETAAIEKLEQAQIAAITARDQAGATASYGDDAVFISERGETSKGRDAIVAGFKSLLADPTLKIDYKPGSKTFSDAGDMAYSTAEYTETYTDPTTKKPVTIKGMNLSVWKRQADGSWKLVADSNPAAPTG
ncbi:hypothetical protein GCM10023264_28460 [Sphingomonas daechungensis]|uniref:SgcJ/EcaC family oxidoreductase n=1 Tax=Sphingomonas daechungensis TaxID=1176646 RepID=A0ABX6SYN7_9SPHN|nr:SgcJ/EcaC family oxidoreductase [Sphingomonas daechungensis]QNP42421.1 SgcJ/EcaC family oxidoreductase [Sphingomonas daechungensis]